MSRQDASDLLMSEKEGGVFLVRDSISIHGELVLCVREDSKVSHYIINKIQQGDKICYPIGDEMIPDSPNLLAFYKLHYLDSTPLMRPAPRKIQRVIARYDLEGKDPDDLPFRRGQVLTIISKDEDQWWTARNGSGQVGSVAVAHVQGYEEDVDTIERVHQPGLKVVGASPVSGTLPWQTGTAFKPLQLVVPIFKEHYLFLLK